MHTIEADVTKGLWETHVLLECQPDASLDLLEYVKQSSGVPSVYNYTEASLLKRGFGYSDH